MNTIDLSINTTNSAHANHMAWATGEWKSTHKITSLTDYCGTYFPSSKRNNNAAKGISVIILDIDENVTLKEGIALFSSSKSLIVTTKSHQKEKNGVIADRFRVILFLNFCIIDMAYYSKLMRVLTRYYKTDIACTDPARYFAPNPKNQLVYYSNSKEIFDITRFDAMIDSSEVMQKHIMHPKKEQEQQITSILPNRVELSSLLDVKVKYYYFGMSTVETLDKLIANTKVSDIAIKCHCFLNPNHVDKNPSCFIYHNEHRIYAKCVSCQIDGIMNFKKQGKNYE